MLRNGTQGKNLEEEKGEGYIGIDNQNPLLCHLFFTENGFGGWKDG